MKKSNFIALILGTIGGVFFALGMCMCLIPEWESFKAGVVVGIIGVLILLAMIGVWRKMENKPPLRISAKTVGNILLGVVGAILLGIGMCMVMVWSKMVLGILIGFVGIVLLLCLIPACKGLR